MQLQIPWLVTSSDGNRYVALGTDKFLLLYFEGQLFDITPIKTKITSVVMAATNESNEISLTFGVQSTYICLHSVIA